MEVTLVALLSWALILIAQNMSFTWVSRARNSGSDWYHATAAVFSNGVWFLAFYFTFDFLTVIQQTRNLGLTFLIGGIYIAATVTGSVVGGKLVRRFFERGKRRVGYYEDKPVIRDVAASEERVVQALAPEGRAPASVEQLKARYPRGGCCA